MQLDKVNIKGGPRVVHSVVWEGHPQVVINMRPRCPRAQQHNGVNSFSSNHLENLVASAGFSAQNGNRKDQGHREPPPSLKHPRIKSEESIANLNIGDLRSLIQDTVRDVVKATSSEGTVPDTGGSGSLATKGDSGELVRVAGRAKSMSIGGNKVARVAIRVPHPSSWVSKA